MKEKIFAILNSFFLIITILTLIFTLIVTEKIAIAIYVISSFIIFFYCFFILSFILKSICKINSKCLDSFEKLFYCIFSILIIILPLLLMTNKNDYDQYKIKCPFTMNDLDYNFHPEKRCQFYNKYTNSRYSYQFICSYNPSEELKKIILSKDEYNNENGLDIVRCLPVNNLLSNYDIISKFNIEYNNSKKYYCNLVFKPKYNDFINEEECDKKRQIEFIIFPILQFLQVILFCLYDCCFYRKNNDNLNESIERNRNRERLNNMNVGLANLYRLFGLLRDLINIVNHENASESNLSTQKSEVINENEDNIMGDRTKNIIIDNNEISVINKDIKSLYKDKSLDKSINLEEIHVDINQNSEDIEMKNENNINNKI